jgi:hypothetical protein
MDQRHTIAAVVRRSGSDRRLALKTAMMLQYTPMHRQGRLIPDHQYAELFARKTSPPDGTEVFIGLERNEPAPGALFALRPLAVDRAQFAGLVPVRSRHLAYEVTMIAGHLVLKVLSHVGPANFALSAGLPPDAAALLRGLWRIWPPESSGGVVLPSRTPRIDRPR